mgnify:CR=1 FL=1
MKKKGDGHHPSLREAKRGRRPNGQSGRLTIKKRDILINLVNLINGHFRTPKIEALHRLIENLNQYCSESIPLLGLDKTPLGESA